MDPHKDLLMDEEHHLVTALVDLLVSCAAGRGDAVDLATYDAALGALGPVMDGLHFLKEERVLFPALQSRGFTRDHAVVNALLSQHESARGYLKRLRDLVALARGGRRDARAQLPAETQAFAGLLREHLRIEDGYFYEVASEHLRPADVEALAAKVARVEQAVGGPAIRAACRRVLGDASTSR